MAPEFGNPIQHLPLVPTDVLKKHHCHETLDTRFRSAARLLQSIWRDDRGLPIGTYTSEDGKKHKLGSRITDAAGKAGGNFLNAEIARIARREIAYREIGAYMDEERLATNLLSSMPLTFNLFAPWVSSLEAATACLKELLPAFEGKATQVVFEHSPGRGNSLFTADYSAFDALIRYTREDGCNGFVAIEIKYSENMREPVPKMRPRYDALSEQCGLFLDPSAVELRTSPLQQLWREHMLAQSMVDAKLYDEGFFVLIGPRLNHHVCEAAKAYQAHLREPDERKVRFIDLTLEDVIEAMRLLDEDHAAALHRRYCDFWLVDGEMELAAATLDQKQQTIISTPEEPSTDPAKDQPKPPNPAGKRVRRTRGH